MESQLNNYQVYGELTIPFYFPTTGISKEEVLKKVALILNRKTINLVDGDIHTIDGNTHPLIAPDCRVRLIEALGEWDI